MDKVKIGCPIEYECDDGVIYDGLFLREPEIKELEKRLKEINKITDLKHQVKKQKEVIDRAITYIEKFVPIEEDTIIMRERQKEYLLELLNRGSDNSDKNR